jgi:hypothetical protein
MTEKMILSDYARRYFRSVLDDAGEGVFIGIGRWTTQPAAWVVPDEWYQRAQACLTEIPDIRRRKATEALRYFRDVLDDAEKHSIFTGISRWNDPAAVWVISAEWYQRAQVCLKEQ